MIERFPYVVYTTPSTGDNGRQTSHLHKDIAEPHVPPCSNKSFPGVPDASQEPSDDSSAAVTRNNVTYGSDYLHGLVAVRLP